ncbi:DUF4349 domain-containing protein [Micromonospora peucetia]|uniref:DUF4349 domain-containing protein n=1 Tax=Micromonospora peucetia TaxID=47871 RepID=A0A1C6UGX4_9ACTN|nr:DUF4349 domain-containing protein [Micromonospora peucetia]MCX4386734.1 DUF4349 domain-containing protein [Micromonospora peucetia]WSA34058.1 DUF4349 domain-containing protein [Micromonospora peucetia]SCL53306.1 protein of unknown function (DUF4349) [Micromonospora peucetia]
MDTRDRRRRGVRLTGIALVALVALAGCGSGAGDDSAGAPAARDQARGAAEQAGGAADQADGAAARGGGKAEPGSGAGAPDLRVDQRSIIYTGTMRVQVDDVDAAARSAIAAVTAAGGFIGGDQRRSADADARAELELRVPAAKFHGVVDELAKLGRQQRREIRTEDVTEQVVDLDARITSQRARVASARQLLARASSISDLVSLENELSRREADLASLEAKKERLADLTSLSTITVSLVGRDASTADEETEVGFMVGLRGGWKVFLTSMTVLLTVLGAVLPWLLLLGVPLTVLLVVLRRQRRTVAPPMTPTGPVAPLPPTAPPPVPAARSGP